MPRNKPVGCFTIAGLDGDCANFSTDRKTKEKAPELRDAIINECFQRGLLVLGAGPTSIRMSPPLIIDEEQAQFAVDTLSDAVGQCSANS